MTSAERNRQAAVLIWSSLIVVTVLLLSRRVAGGIGNVSSVWPSVLVSSLATLLSGFGWASFQQQTASRSLRTEQIAAVVAWLPTWLSGVALLPSDSTLARGWLFGIAALVGDRNGVECFNQPETRAKGCNGSPLVRASG